MPIPRNEDPRYPHSRPKHEPTPEEIEAGTAAIRAKWTGSEKRSRCCYENPRADVLRSEDPGKDFR